MNKQTEYLDSRRGFNSNKTFETREMIKISEAFETQDLSRSFKCPKLPVACELIQTQSLESVIAQIRIDSRIESRLDSINLSRWKAFQATFLVFPASMRITRRNEKSRRHVVAYDAPETNGYRVEQRFCVTKDRGRGPGKSFNRWMRLRVNRWLVEGSDANKCEKRRE